MTQRLNKKKMTRFEAQIRKLVTNGPEAQNKNKHSSPDKIWRLQFLFQQSFQLKSNIKKILLF